jgi:CHAT domain-containing protein/Tfp pilus assembly protein PilF
MSRRRQRVRRARQRQRPRVSLILGAAAALAVLAGCTGTANPGAEARFRQAEAAFEAERHEEALRILALAESGAADAALRFRVRVLRGEVLAAKADYRASVEVLRGAAGSGSDVSFEARRGMTLGLSECRMASTAAQRREALRLIDDVLGQLEPGSNLWGQTQLRRGTCLMRMEEYEESGRAFQAAARTGAALQDKLLEARSRAANGNVYARQEHYDAASREMEQAYRIASRAGPAAAATASRAMDNLGWIFYELGDYDRALETLKQFQPATDRELIINQQNLGNVYLALGEPEKARPYYERSLAAARRIGDKQWEADSLSNFAFQAFAVGNLREARRWNEEELAIRRSLKEPRAELKAALSAARIAAAEGACAEAVAELRKVTASPLASNRDRWSAWSVLAGCEEKSGHFPGAETALKKAVALVERSRADLAEVEDQITFHSSRMDVYRNAAEYFMRRGRTNEALEIIVRSRGQGERLDAKRASRIGRQGTVLVYALAEPASHLWVIGPKGARHFRLAGAGKLRDLVQRHNASLLRARDPLHEGAAEARELYRELVAPAAGEWQHPQVTISADGVLHHLNWETLVAPGPDRYWIEDVEIRMSPALSGRTRQEKPAGKERILLVGDPEPGGERLSRLPHAAAELENLGREFGPQYAVVLSKERATPERVKEELSGAYGYVHFAAHATANALRPLESSVVLTGRNGAGKLYARDLAGVRLKARLVTLSACSAAGSKVLHGEGLVGLAWAFMQAGAEDVVASLWNVEDATTATLMEAMYRQLRLGRSPEQALREAKLVLLRSGSAARKPYYWGAFLLFRN